MPTKTLEQLEGIVKFFDRTKHWGYITGENEEYFCHSSNIKGSLKVLYKDQKVAFNAVKTQRGLLAVNVKVIE